MPRRVALRSERGQAAVELALVLPILCALVLAIAQLGIVWNNYETITDAARAGARKAIVERFVGDNGASAVTAARNSAGNLDQSKLGVTVSDSDWSTAGTTVTVTVTYPYSINILGWTVQSGTLTSTTQESLE